MKKNICYKMDSINELEKIPLSEQVYKTLRKAILTKQLLPTTKLNEVDIATQLKVSATPVREAFRKLAMDNLVVIQPWRGVRVKGLSDKDINEIYQCLEVLLGLSARLCVEIATNNDLDLLISAKTELINSTRKENDKYTLKFLTLLIKISNNERIHNFINSYIELLQQDISTNAQNAMRAEAVKKEVSEIIDSIIKRNARKAEERMKRYIRNIYTYKKAKEDYKRHQEEKLDELIDE